VPLPIQRRYQLLKPVFNERLRRLWAAAEALSFGEGGVSVLAGTTGFSRTTIRSGIEELQGSKGDLAELTREGRVRRRGAGRKALVERDGTLEADLEALLESSEEGQGCALDWTCKSIRCVTEELAAQGHQVSYRTIGNHLHRMGYCFSPAESYKKFPVAARRDQFRRISQRTFQFLASGEPVVSLVMTDEARRQLVAPNSKSAGLGVSLLRYWWQESGERKLTGSRRRMLLLVDAAGHPSGDRATWAPLLLTFASDARLEIDVGHFPPGARRWRRRVEEASCSVSRSDQSSEALIIELASILPVEGDTILQAATRARPATVLDDVWNYRIDGQPSGLSK